MVEEIIKLLKFFDSSKIEELELETKDFKVRAKKPLPPVLTKGDEAPSAVEVAQLSETLEPQEASEALEEKNYHVIEAPMVGTFYRAPAPGAEPFVKEGDYVEKGQTLCIIEALKVMNEIESDVSGIVRKILVEDGQPVEYGQPLFYIEPR
jgi:acetyl-CoA carboxylase biotin carboxyl carrier protein